MKAGDRGKAQASCLGLFALFSLRYETNMRSLAEVEAVSAEVCSGDGDGGDRGGLRTENAGAEGDRLPAVTGEERHFFRGPAALRTDGEGDGFDRGLEGCLEGGGLLDLAEEDAGWGGFGGEDGREREGIGDGRDRRAAGLLGGFEGDATPTVGSLGGCLSQMLFGTAGEDGGDAVDPELGGFFDGPLEVIELEDGEQEMKRKGGVSFELFVKGEGDAVRGDGGDLSTVEKATGNEVEDLAWFRTENTGEMSGLIAGEGCGVVVAVPGVSDEAAAGHGGSLVGSCRGTMWGLDLAA